VKFHLVIPAVALLAALSACGGTQQSGASGLAGGASVGTASRTNEGGFWHDLGGGPQARAQSSYQNELRAENSN
jgi:ABC-type glycerol-3-phosphate transport system substrate-binding protein